MEPEERRFWVLITFFGSFFAVGLDLVFREVGWGIAFIAFGLIGVLISLREGWRFRERLAQVRSRFPSARTILFAAGSIVVSVLIAYTVSQIFAIRDDLNAYVMPRMLTAKQKSEIHEVLTGHAPSTAVNVVVNVGDDEAMQYAGQLFQAIQDSGWDVHLWPVNPFDANADARTRTGSFNNSLLLLDRGVSIRVDNVGDPRPDPNHPTPDALLKMAFDKAQLGAGDAGAANRDIYSVTIAVGRRPLSLKEPGPSPLYRLGLWLEQFGHYN